ncbi:ATP-binding cassette domain-containing protein [Altererythrobacter aquaemixtae]|uniref:ATP-binding cassette domain-containing protein n=2 Tax=Pontixanthobacter aquaemixtae TaxID=1958940 RepID=A0A844ZZK0_9SPHN|nr:ATP-binding cassette domain-containing protein [Pontixanthobacter aquaemixtae]
MIHVRDLHKSYATRFGRNVVLEGIDFDLAMGERLGILGRNGAGKSTMIRLVSGAEKPTSGMIERSMSVSWPLAFGGAFQPQLTGIDNIRFITSIYDQDFEKNLAFVEDFAELGPYLREPVRTYSSGMRARLAFAISMIIEFDCFLIDEIGAVGDARFHDRCNYELFDVRSDRAMMIISHDAGYVREHCNRWAILHDGRLSQFDDFEVAYSTYKELIGVDMHTQPVAVNYSNRARMVDSSQHAALTDERFRVHVQQGDWARDESDWKRAAAEYSKALALYPYQRSYWTQLGHVEKVLGNFANAEIAYRTAVALGEPMADVEVHAGFVVEQQGDSIDGLPLRAPTARASAWQPPSKPDFDALNWLLRAGAECEPEDMLDQVRQHETLDALAAAMVLDAGNPLAPPPDNHALFERAKCLVGGSPGEASSADQLLPTGAFADWPQTRAAIQARQLENRIN